MEPMTIGKQPRQISFVVCIMVDIEGTDYHYHKFDKTYMNLDLRGHINSHKRLRIDAY